MTYPPVRPNVEAIKEPTGPSKTSLIDGTAISTRRLSIGYETTLESEPATGKTSAAKLIN